MNETKPKRCWFRFSLRMLFFLVTIVGVAAGWVAYQLNWIRERDKFSAQHIEYRRSIRGEPYFDAPWNLKVFGELGRHTIHVLDSTFYQARALFPEAVEIIDADKD
jgi:hypothetical protein